MCIKIQLEKMSCYYRNNPIYEMEQVHKYLRWIKIDSFKYVLWKKKPVKRIEALKYPKFICSDCFIKYQVKRFGLTGISKKMGYPTHGIGIIGFLVSNHVGFCIIK